jgi:prepilin-type N-terminal cleavage/methylation domain-containing protein
LINHQHPKGFTLIELLITIALIVIVFSIATYNFFESQKKVVFQNSVSEVMTTIKQAQNFARSSKIIKLNIDDEIQEIIPAGGYGIYINGTEERPTLITYSDIWNESQNKMINTEDYQNIDGVFQKIWPDSIYTADTAKDFELDQYLFPEAVTIKSIVLIDNNGNNVIPDPAIASIIFIPPFAETIIADSTGNSDYLEILITLENQAQVRGDKEKTIRLHRITGFPTTEVNL